MRGSEPNMRVETGHHRIEVNIEEVDQQIFPEFSTNNSRSLIIIASNSRGCQFSQFSPLFPSGDITISICITIFSTYTSYTSPDWRHHHLKQLWDIMDSGCAWPMSLGSSLARCRYQLRTGTWWRSGRKGQWKE